MADIGCGLALLDFYLTGNVKSVTAIDIDESALAEVERHIDEELAANRTQAAKIETLKKDASGLADERWDIVLMSFFADTPETVGRMLSLAEHRGVIIMHGHERGGIFDPVITDRPRMTVREMEDYLKSNGYGYRKSIVDLQFGQPFRSIEDIHEFLGDKVNKGYGLISMPDDAADGIAEATREKTGEETEAFDIDRLVYSAEDRIIRTKRYDYPYYLPRNLHTAVFIVVPRR
jgi:hypothetical protein